MRKYSSVRIIYLCIIIIGLLGVSYAGWTDIGKMLASITTGFLDYDFQESGNSLVLIRNESTIPIPASITVDRGKYLRIDILDAGPIMNMTGSDKLRIYYALKNGENGNVPLKAKEEELGIISIELKRDTVRWDLSGGDYNASDYLNLLPENLGVFKAYHSFNGTGGMIDFTPVYLPAKPIDSITYDYSEAVTAKNDESAPDPELDIQDQAYAFDTVASEPDLSITESEEAFSHREEAAGEGVDLPAASSDNESSMEKMDPLKGEESSEDMQDADYENKDVNGKKDRGKNIKRKLLISRETISISAEYGFIIPLRLDQFNAETE